jgi:hypothetical protein
MQSIETNSTAKLVRQNLRLVKRLYPGLRQQDFQALRILTRELHLSVLKGEFLYIEGKWYVTHSGLLQIALRRRCLGIYTTLLDKVCDLNVGRWVFKATVYKSRRSRGFVGYGDADPSNVSSLVHGAEMRVAEIRAVNRALRKAYGVGVCSVEELGWASRSKPTEPPDQPKVSTNGNSGDHSGQPRLRDRLCLLIRQYHLDASLVKAYAAHYCGTATLRDASRDQIETFINSLAEAAAKDRDGLVCRLNSYAKQPEASS